MAAERIQLNLRLDGRPDLLADIKEAADLEQVSVNTWCVRAFEKALGKRSSVSTSANTSDIEATIEQLLEKKLATLLDRELEERLGKFRRVA